MPRKKLEKFHTWNICEPCAKERGGTYPIGLVFTMTSGICAYCKKPATLIPLRDFSWVAPKKGKK